MKAVNIYREPYEEGLGKTGNLKLEGNKDIAVHNQQNGTYDIQEKQENVLHTKRSEGSSESVTEKPLDENFEDIQKKDIRLCQLPSY